MRGHLVAHLIGTSCVVTLVLAASGCGVPGDGTARIIARDDVPYRLLDASPSPSAFPSPSKTGKVTRVPQVFLVNADEQLVPQAHSVGTGDPTSALHAVLAALATGPDARHRERGLGTALGPDIRLRLVGVDDGVARIALSGVPHTSPADRLPLAVGQVVLTATSIDGIDGVVLMQDGQRIEVPLPGGELTSEPVRAADYLTLLAAEQARTSPTVTIS